MLYIFVNTYKLQHSNKGKKKIDWSGPEVLNFFHANSTKQEISTAHKN